METCCILLLFLLFMECKVHLIIITKWWVNVFGVFGVCRFVIKYHPLILAQGSIPLSVVTAFSLTSTSLITSDLCIIVPCEYVCPEGRNFTPFKLPLSCLKLLHGGNRQFYYYYWYTCCSSLWKRSSPQTLIFQDTKHGKQLAVL